MTTKEVGPYRFTITQSVLPRLGTPANSEISPDDYEVLVRANKEDINTYVQLCDLGSGISPRTVSRFSPTHEVITVFSPEWIEPESMVVSPLLRDQILVAIKEL